MDKQIVISTGHSRFDTSWARTSTTWGQLVYQLSKTKRTSETVYEYQRMPKKEQAKAKDHGGFVGGELVGGRRKKGCVTSRQLLTLDIDKAQQRFWENYQLGHDWASVLYSTHSHTPDRPRLRLVILLSRPVSCEEYEAIGRKVAQSIGIEQVDPTTFEAHRLMYWPSTPADGEFVHEHQDGPALNADEVLASYVDWRDWTRWPRAEGERVHSSGAIKQADPRTKGGFVGLFCRAYSVPAAIERFLPGVYVPSATDVNRWTYAPGETSNGLIIYNNGDFCMSHHGSDPAAGQLLNAFDLVRIHKFGSLDDDAKPGTPTNRLPSFEKMLQLARDDELVKAQSIADDFGVDVGQAAKDWRMGLEKSKTGHILANLANLVLILSMDENINKVGLNAMAERLEVTGEGWPWRRSGTIWRDADDAQLNVYLNANYARFSSRDYIEAITKVADDRAFHPLRDELKSLRWDGVERAETLLVDYLGAQDDIYTRQATFKTLQAAVARVFSPGIKFDAMLVLDGPQGVGKSTLFRLLARGWYSDSLTLTDMKDKTGAEKLQGYWIIEIPELAGMRKADVESVKGFISRNEDNYRAAYGRRVESRPRQSIIVGTTNAVDGYMRDTTGNRRYWAIGVSGDSVRKPWQLSDFDIDQIWAEVVEATIDSTGHIKPGVQLYLSGEAARLAEQAQAQKMEPDEREGMVREYLSRKLPTDWDSRSLQERKAWLDHPDAGASDGTLVERRTVCNAEIWAECFGYPPAALKPWDSYQIASIMGRIEDWERPKKQRRNIPIYGRQRVYVKAHN